LAYVFIPGVGPCVEQAPLVSTERGEQIEEIRLRHVEAVQAAYDYLLNDTEMDVWEIEEIGLGEGFRRPRKLWYHPDAGGVYPEYPGAIMYLFCEVPMFDEGG
jgi:hypothetical protein